MTKIFVLPDCQVKPGHSNEYLSWIGQYIVEKKPDVIVNIGDFADMESLSSYDVGKKSFEGRTYAADINASVEAMATLLAPLNTYNERAASNRKKQYRPRMVLTVGNHEERINRAINNDRKLEGLISVDDLQYREFGWEVFPFLDVVVIEGIAFSHYFTTGAMGRPSTTANAQLNKQHMSCIAGHQQGLQIAMGHRGDGTRLTSIIAGSCYEHDEDYLGAQGNKHWRGALMLHNCEDGQFDLVTIPLSYFKEKYDK